MGGDPADGACISAIWLNTPGAQLVQNELPGSDFEPISSERIFNLCICSPLDNYLTSVIFNKVNEAAPNIHLIF